MTSYKLQKTNPKCWKSRQLRGFTLIEVSISATLFLFSAMVFYWSTINSLQYLAVAKKQARAVYTCQSKLEQLRSLSLEDLDSLNGDSFGDGKGKIEVVEVYAQMRQVEVEYRYDDKREPVKLVRLVN